MTEHLTVENIELYRRREIDPAARREADAHLAKCEECLDRVLDSEHSALAFNSLNEALLPSKNEAPYHLSKVELRSYFESSLDEADRIIYGSHLEDCERCKGGLEELSKTVALLSQQTAPVRQMVPARRLWPRWAWLTPAQAAVAIAIVGLLAFGLVQLRRQQSPTEVISSDPQPTAPGSGGVPGNIATPGPGASVTTTPSLVVLKDNNSEIRLEHDGKLAGLEGLDDATQRVITAALKGEELPKPRVLDELSQKIKLLGTPDGDSFELIGPLGTVVADNRPTLRWRALPGADSYVVSIFDENFNGVALSPPLTATQWTSNVSLKRGHTYSWEVTATRNGKAMVAPSAPVSAAKFRMLEEGQRNDLAKRKQQSPLSHLALGLAYARAGLISDAEREFRQLAKENPDSPVAKKLLRTVQGWK
ncbi:MAG: zf-HC2 domain-containing protein [Acidobacteriota bacterium]